MEPAEGVQVTENVRLLRRLREGGMASVWIAEHLSLRTRVAVKFIAPELVSQSPELVARFNREATAAASIKSPHVVQILDHGLMEDGTPYIVMELLEGEDLGQLLAREGKLAPARVVGIAAQVCKALGKAHAVGVIHRDVKPDNLFLTPGDEDEPLVKVLDFGVAKQSAAPGYSVVTATGTMMGTPAYMSPEQVLSGKHVDARTDLWSLGVVAYQALTGDIPFQGETLGALCVAISRGTFAAPSKVNPALPKALDAWMSKALAAFPDDRFGTAKEMAETLRAALAGAASSDTAPGTGTPREARPAGGEGDTMLVPPGDIGEEDRAEPHFPIGKTAAARLAALHSVTQPDGTIVVPKKRLPLALIVGVALIAAGGALAAVVLSRARPENASATAAAIPAATAKTAATSATTATSASIATATSATATATTVLPRAPVRVRPARVVSPSLARPPATRDRGF